MNRRSGLDTDRIETLADGVFAIAMTLLVFEIGVPRLAQSELGRLASRDHRLVDSDLDAATIRIATRRILTGPVVYLLAVAISVLSRPVALIVYAAVPLLYILPARIDRSWIRGSPAKGAG